jgi:hypothetical protein
VVAAVGSMCRTALRRRGITARTARKGIEPSGRLGRHRYVIERATLLACAVICYRRATRTDVLLTNSK